jgi:hypothetical protein
MQLIIGANLLSEVVMFNSSPWCYSVNHTQAALSRTVRGFLPYLPKCCGSSLKVATIISRQTQCMTSLQVYVVDISVLNEAQKQLTMSCSHEMPLSKLAFSCDINNLSLRCVCVGMTLHRTTSTSTRRTSRWLLYRETMGLYRQNPTDHINIQRVS